MVDSLRTYPGRLSGSRTAVRHPLDLTIFVPLSSVIGRFLVGIGFVTDMLSRDIDCEPLGP